MKSSKLILLVILAAVFVAIVRSDFFKSSPLGAEILSYIPSVHSVKARSLPPSPEQMHYKVQDEENWIVDSVARDITEILVASKGSGGLVAKQYELVTLTSNTPGAYNLRSRVNGSEQDYSLQLQHYIWAEENYNPWAGMLIKALKINPTAPRADNDKLAVVLTAANSTNLITESTRVSKELTAAPLDAELHEEAALILGAFALREECGSYTDVRPSLCRMSTHLAVASSLRRGGSAGKNGELASVIMLALANREEEALEKLTARPPANTAWRNALRLRITGDWRILTKPAEATLLEQVEYGRALGSSLANEALADFVTRTNKPEVIDWSRIILSHNFSVEQGHLFALPSLNKEMAEFAKDCELLTGKQVTQENFVELLNTPAGRCVQDSGTGSPSLAVLGLGDVAAFHQRHIFESAKRTMYFLRELWSVSVDAGQYSLQLRAQFSNLTLFPILAVYFSRTSTDFESSVPAAVALCSDHPELVTMANHDCLSNDGSAKYGAIPNTWIKIPLPYETALDFETRVSGSLDRYNMLSNVGWDELRKIAPYDYFVLSGYAAHLPTGKVTLQQAIDIYKTIVDYNAKALWGLCQAAGDDIANYTLYLSRACHFLPNWWFTLGDYYVSKNMPEKAAEAYQQGVDLAPDHVLVANSCDWLVNYYYDHGRQDDALKIARIAAEVYSARGLETLGAILERMQKWDEAEDLYKKEVERYGEPAVLTGFYARNKNVNPEYEAQFESRVKATFPNGLEHVTMANFTAPPMDGARVSQESELSRMHRLGTGAVLVSLDGYRVHSTQQYYLLRGFTNDPNVDIIAWMGNHYEEVKANIPGRKFGCNLEEFTP